MLFLTGFVVLLYAILDRFSAHIEVEVGRPSCPDELIAAYQKQK